MKLAGELSHVAAVENSPQLELSVVRKFQIPLCFCTADDFIQLGYG